jgi:2-polyprenyl-6-methoxyphenol hydroxylase-like FAD-dependent oxidoreductase
VAELREVGAGVLLAANAQKALGKLGLAEAVARLGMPASAGEIRSWRGAVLASIPAAELEKKFGTPSAAVHRADLQELLVRVVGERTLRLGAEVKAFEQDESGVRVLFADGSQEDADILVGADGLRSRVRAVLFGPEEPRYAGYTSWRAVVEPGEELLPWGTSFESWGEFYELRMDGVLRNSDHLPPTCTAGRLVPSGLASRNTSWVMGAVSPSPNSRKRNR